MRKQVTVSFIEYSLLDIPIRSPLPTKHSNLNSSEHLLIEERSSVLYKLKHQIKMFLKSYIQKETLIRPNLK